MHIIIVFASMTLMHVIAIMLIIACPSVQDGWNLSALGWFMSLTTRNLSCTSFSYRVSSANFLWFPLVTPALSSTTCATHSLALPATAGWVLAMDARCGSSTRWLWVGRGTCNESSGVAARGNAWRNFPGDLHAYPCLGHANVSSACAVLIPLDSSGSA